MPYIDVRIFEGRLTPQTQERLIAALTDAVVDVFDESIREQTWIVLNPVDPARWGIGGRPCGRDRAVAVEGRDG
ncbi:tautomerase family protein [Pseudonocardia sichuanensis]|uniref:4-oxalocrotonate tautomerase n=1 Tax=Pseudonocardia kunmingensis TaxID=630975 RepID=A0A543DJ27_9PSEU|nr:4-oxalocrotonate tautomerase family protein [Pseudonocardia kunmingensis]TQM09332.1 4-oxalocrotonate tautomerase [Pseudonocardia kunmingensis]